MSRCPRVCIVGAGISGLSTAVFLQQSGVKADVTIIADKFSPNTTSDVAAGVWGPHAVADTPEHLVRYVIHYHIVVVKVAISMKNR